MKKTQKIIKGEKAVNRNVYSLNDGAFKVLWFFGIGITVASIAEPFLRTYGVLATYLIMGAVALLVLALGLLFSKKSAEKLIPYARQKEKRFNFLGLHNIADEELTKIGDGGDDIISRDVEAQYIGSLLEDVIFPQNYIKQALCITGKSGCGKSTILAFFQQKYENEYEIHNFSGNYNALRSALENKFNTGDIDGEIKKRCRDGKKIVFIFDQFERYFYLTEEKQLDVRNFIASLCMKNTAIITSMREDFLAEFLREFDLHDIKSNYKTNDEVSHKGLMRRLVGYVKETENYVVIHGSRRKISVSRWETDSIKTPLYLHVAGPDSLRAAIDKTEESTIFYCENQNKMKVSAGGEEENSSTMKDKCVRKFGEAAGTALYEKYSGCPLIEQQIIFHMAEFDREIRCDETTARKFAKSDANDIMKRYFDVQLSSTNDYFNASRVMYLLSSARLHQISMKTEDIIGGLRADQFSKRGRKDIRTAIEKLEKLQLIRKNSSNSDNEYEIAHDYISTAFLNYSRANMDRNVKSALDIFLADFVDDFRENLRLSQRDAAKKKEQKEKNGQYDPAADRFYTVVTVITCILVLGIDVLFRFFWNPWEELPLGNPLQSVFPLFIPIHIFLSIIYFYQFFDKIFKYRGKRSAVILKIEYLLMVLVALVCEGFYPHFIITDGLGLVVVGATACFILTKDYRESSRAAMFGYGIKCVVVGFAFALAHVLFYVSQGTFPTFLIGFEMAAETLLVGYAHFSHMTREYLYGRCMDVSGKKKN